MENEAPLPEESHNVPLEEPVEIVLETNNSIQDLEEDVELILGENPSLKIKNEITLHPSLVSRWSNWLSDGVPNESINQLLEKYSRNGNISLESPNLNEEISSALNESMLNRDKKFVLEQKMAGSALSALGQGISMILNDQEEPLDRLELLKRFADAGKLLTHIHYQFSVARKAFVSPLLTKSIKTVLEKTKPGPLLFGENLIEKINSAKSIEKISKDIRNVPVPSTSSAGKSYKQLPSRNLNWRGQNAKQGSSVFSPKMVQRRAPQIHQNKYKNKSQAYNKNHAYYKNQKPTKMHQTEKQQK